MNKQIVTQNHTNEPVTTSLVIASGTEIDHASVIKLVRTYAVDLSEFGLLDFKSESSGGRPTEYAVLNEQQATLLITYMRNTDIVRKFKMMLVKAFYELKQASIPKTFADALRLAADQQEQIAQIAVERDTAIATKAQIGSNREATAMATASAATRKAKRLEAELDQSMQYASVKRMEMLYHGQKFNWRHLKGAGTEMGIQSIDIFDANYGTVKAYHADVWREAYALDINQTEVA